MGPLHVVFGAGQVGVPLALALASRGCEVRVVSRSGAGAGTPGVVAVRADAGDPEAATAAARGAVALYHCMNPPYSAKVWEAQLPRIAGSLLTAAGRSGARLVVLDNVYALGNPRGQPLDEESRVAPCSRKGEIRARVAAQLLDAHRAGQAKVVLGRASDFFGPGGVNSYFGPHFWKRVLAGKSAQALGDPDTAHTWHFIPDVAAGLAALGEAPEAALGRPWMLPAGPPVTTREMMVRLAAAAGRKAEVQRLPRLLLSLMAVFVPMFRELLEMDYQWDGRFEVDGRRFQERFGVAPTPLDEAVRQTAAWGMATYGKKG
ncbi:MAG: NAD-dependent epimerase/dehydratase family protein [Deltaproteobacteria bacterium]|nr:NAD-dependent epimerase/dehydratase family protein [Deltaproteobacteria bacterium]